MKNIIIIGAGEGGKRLLGEIKRAYPHLNAVGFLDDDKKYKNQKILGLPVLGTTDNLKKLKIKIDEIIIAIPSLRGSHLAKIIAKIQPTKIPYRIMPGIFESIEYYTKRQVPSGEVREVELSDLLNREPIEINLETISSYLQNKVVLITGGGGSIGSEIARQVFCFHPDKLILLDIYENNLFELEQELTCPLETVVTDIKDRPSLERIFKKYQPKIVFHAAAHKHVPLMEKEPQEAVKNNILSSSNLIELSQKYQVQRFIFISTDKAIEPTSIMGATKRFTEQEILSQADSGTLFSIVRFGNVLGSYGSVIPLWKKQLRAGKPLTVTHPEMRRFFMTIPEAVSLVIQTGAFTTKKVIYVLKMGKQYRILDLAQDFIKLSGLVPDKSAKIEITQIRPGEKLSETLYEKSERISSSTHNKISIITPKLIPQTKIKKVIEKFRHDIDLLNYQEIVRILKEVIPTFQPYGRLMKPKKISQSIPFSPPSINQKEIAAVTKILKSGWLTMGPEVLKFEENFKKFYGVENAVAVSSATAGLHLSLISFDIGTGDEVILPSYTFASCANVITHTGAKPVFADITKEGFLIDPVDIERKITKKTKAIMVIHFGGQMAEMDELVKIAKNHNLKIIEDCAHSLGARYRERLAGTIGDIGVFSFYANKNLTTGEGGMAIAKDNKIISRMRSLRLHGMNPPAFDRYCAQGKWYYEIEEAGFKYNLTDLAAAIGNEQLKKIRLFNKQRNIIAQYYLDNLKNDKIILPQVLPHREHVWHLFPILVEPHTRNRLTESLKEFNITTSVHFIPLHLQPYYQRNYGYKKGDLPISEWVYEREISLPIYPDLSEEKINYICQVIKYLNELR